jgi:hypothetical protein
VLKGRILRRFFDVLEINFNKMDEHRLNKMDIKYLEINEYKEILK